MYERNPPDQLMNTNSLLNFPEEILFDEILSRLPVKSLLRFKCVSKPWRSLIESDRFIEIHYRYSAKNPRVLAGKPILYGISGGFSLQSLLDSKEGSVFPTEIEAKDGARLLGCCNGVVCCYGDRRFWLWNPATRVSVKLPYILGLGALKWGFGWDESSSAYKVFVELISYVRSGWVYSSNTNSWRKSPPGTVHELRQTGLFLRGNLHWVEWSLPQVECFDLGREEFGMIKLPFKDEVWKKSYSPGLGVISGSLGLILDVKERLDVWVMKKYGVKDSWLKILTFPTITAQSTCSIYFLFGEGLNGEIYVGRENKLSAYSPKDDAFSTITAGKDPFVEPFIYVESLASPKRILDATNTTS